MCFFQILNAWLYQSKYFPSIAAHFSSPCDKTTAGSQRSSHRSIFALLELWGRMYLQVLVAPARIAVSRKGSCLESTLDKGELPTLTVTGFL